MRKLLNNLGLSAFRVLGLKQYIFLILGFLRHFVTIVRTKKLTSLDKWMSKKLLIRYRGARFFVDCRTIDNMIPEASYTFGLIREIYIANCYFQFEALPGHFKNVIDLGGNRGIFSLLAAQFSDNVVYVEAQQHYQQALRHNMEINGITNISIVTAYMGAETALARSSLASKSIDDIMYEQALDRVDFLKIDVEGSEFSLFASITLLAKINCLALEVHPRYGDPAAIIKLLNEHGFSTSIRDQDLTVLAQPLTDRLFYIYASHADVRML